jgi:Flp pilus assembly protein TadD
MNRLTASALALLAGLASGCTATREETGAVPAAGAEPGGQASRLGRIAADIEARGDPGTALALYERAIEVDGSPAAYVRLGEAYRRLGKLDKAVGAYQAALAKNPDDGPALLGIGSVQVMRGDVDAGLEALARAAPIVRTAEAYNRLGVGQTLAGRPAEAITSYEKAAALAPADLDIRTNLALAHALAGNGGRAVEIMRETARSPSAGVQHRRNLVIVLGLAGQGAEALASPPGGLSPAEVRKLLARAEAIGRQSDPRKRAAILGATAG